jgi:ATP synthase protein I
MATENPGQDPLDREDPRLMALDKRLAEVQRDEAIRSGKKTVGQGKGYSQGNRVLSALIGGIAGGALIGWLLDRWFGTAPLLLLALMFLGIIVAFRNIIKISGERPD